MGKSNKGPGVVQKTDGEAVPPGLLAALGRASAAAEEDRRYADHAAIENLLQVAHTFKLRCVETLPHLNDESAEELGQLQALL